MTATALRNLFTAAGLHRNSGDLREYEAGKQIIGNLVHAGEVEYDEALGTLVEYLKI